MDVTLDILIIEDDENDVTLLRMALKRAGMASCIRVVNNGEQAIHYLCGNPPYDNRMDYPFPQVIFSDIKMPRMDGFGVLDWLRNHPDCAVIPFIILSNSNNDADIKRAYQMGANAFLTKPDSLENLQEMVRTAFEFWQWCSKPHVPVKC